MASSRAVSSSPSKRVLIVEDDPATQRLLAVLLQRGGFSTTIAINGEQAIELLRAGSFELIILDLMMPKVGGHAVIDYLRDERIEIPVIVCTAAHATGNVDASVVKAVVRKPFDIDELLSIASATLPGMFDAVLPHRRKP